MTCAKVTPRNEPNAARVAANRENALKSTGPRTEAGLAAASQNALKHGLSARTVLVRGEIADEWTTHREAVLADLAPSTAVASALAERAAEILWRLGRAGAAEAAVIDATIAAAEHEAITYATTAHPLPDPFEWGHSLTVAELVATVQTMLHHASALLDLRRGADTVPAATAHVALQIARRHLHVTDARVGAVERGDAVPRANFEGLLEDVAEWHYIGALHAFNDEDEDEDDELVPPPVIRRHTPEDLLAHVSDQVTRAATSAALTRDVAQKRLAVLRASALEATAPVQRHEAHLQRQLAGVLRLLAQVSPPRSSSPCVVYLPPLDP